MKNIIATAAAAATLFAGSAAFAEGGYIDQQTYMSEYRSEQQKTATKQTVELQTRNGVKEIEATVIATDLSLAPAVNQGS